MSDESPTPPAPKPAPDTPAAPKPARKPRASAGAAATGPAKPRAPRKKLAAPPPPPPPPRRLWLAAGVAAATIAVDQLTKWVVVHLLNLKEVQDIQLWEPWLNLRMAWNQGVNFGLFSSDETVMRWVLVAVALVVCGWVAVWLVRTRPGRWIQAAAGLLIGGALGNVIDRVAYGAVADFLNMSLPAWRNPYSFNVADIAIFAGALGLVFLPGPADGADKTRDGTAKTR